MSGLTLFIGNKNYSSWSFRPWLALREAGIPFKERLVPFRYGEPGGNAHFLEFSPTALVPVLVDGDIRVWDSLAILEYLAERHPDAGLWPRDRAARAHARAVCAEMHSGFAALRGECAMNMRREPRPLAVSDKARADVARIEALWADTRQRFGQGGPLLFGRFTAADAMYAPVVCRLHVYGHDVSPETRAYMEAVMALEGWREWDAAARAEPWVIAHEDY